MNALKATPLAAPVRITATATGAAIDLRSFDGVAMLTLNSGAMEAAATTMDVKIQHSADGSTGWTDATVLRGSSYVPLAFAQVTNAAASSQQIDFNVKDLKRYIREVKTLAGTSPAVTAGVSLIAKLQKT